MLETIEVNFSIAVSTIVMAAALAYGANTATATHKEDVAPHVQKVEK